MNTKKICKVNFVEQVMNWVNNNPKSKGFTLFEHNVMVDFMANDFQHYMNKELEPYQAYMDDSGKISQTLEAKTALDKETVDKIQRNFDFNLADFGTLNEIFAEGKVLLQRMKGYVSQYKMEILDDDMTLQEGEGYKTIADWRGFWKGFDKCLYGWKAQNPDFQNILVRNFKIAS